MTTMQRERLNEYMAALDFRQRVAKQVCKVGLALMAAVIIIALVLCGTGCVSWTDAYKQFIAPHSL